MEYKNNIVFIIIAISIVFIFHIITNSWWWEFISEYYPGTSGMRVHISNGEENIIRYDPPTFLKQLSILIFMVCGLIVANRITNSDHLFLLVIISISTALIYKYNYIGYIPDLYRREYDVSHLSDLFRFPIIISLIYYCAETFRNKENDVKPIIYFMFASIVIYILHISTYDLWIDFLKYSTGSINHHRIFGKNTPYWFRSEIFVKQLPLLIFMSAGLVIASIKSKKYGIVPSLILGAFAGAIYIIYPIDLWWWLQGSQPLWKIVNTIWAYSHFPIFFAFSIYLFMKIFNKKVKHKNYS